MAAKQFNLVPNPGQILPGPQLGDLQSLANAISGFTGMSSQDSITASTTQTQVGGTVLDATISRITTAAASDAVTLARQAKPGRGIIIINDSGQTIQLFPLLGDKINDAAANASVTIADNTLSIYFSPVANKWFGGPITFET